MDKEKISLKEFEQNMTDVVKFKLFFIWTGIGFKECDRDYIKWLELDQEENYGAYNERRGFKLRLRFDEKGEFLGFEVFVTAKEGLPCQSV